MMSLDEQVSDRWVNEILEYLNKTSKTMPTADILKTVLKLDYHSMTKKQQNVWMCTKASLRTDSRFKVESKTKLSGQEYELVSLA